MLSAMQNQIALSLHESAGRLSLLLDALLPSAEPPAAQLRVASPQQIAALLAELRRAGEWLRELPEEKDREARLQQELASYRQEVQRLHTLLPGIQAALLAERARLEQKRKRVSSAAEWMHTSRQTL